MNYQENNKINTGNSFSVGYHHPVEELLSGTNLSEVVTIHSTTRKMRKFIDHKYIGPNENGHIKSRSFKLQKDSR